MGYSSSGFLCCSSCTHSKDPALKAAHSTPSNWKQSTTSIISTCPKTERSWFLALVHSLWLLLKQFIPGCFSGVWTHIRSTNYWLSPNTFKIQIGWVCGENCIKIHSESKYFIHVFLSYCFFYVCTCSLLVVLFMKKWKMKIKRGVVGGGGGVIVFPSNLRKLLQMARTRRSLDNTPTWWFRPVFVPDLLVLCDANLKLTDKICGRLNCLQHCSSQSVELEPEALTCKAFRRYSIVLTRGRTVAMRTSGKTE